MLLVFLMVCFCVLFPFSFLFLLEKDKNNFANIVLSIPLQAACIGVGSVLTRTYAYGSLKLLIVTCLSFIVTCILIRKINNNSNLRYKNKLSIYTVASLLILALILACDNLFILGSQGWSFDPYRLFQSASYFRGPLNTDGERNLILINSIIRGGGSAFFPGFEYTYQLFWFYFAALFVSLFNGVTLYSVVSGVTQATAFLFYFTVCLILVIVRPSWAKNKIKLILFLMLLFVHADILNAAISLIKQKVIGIEADGSVEWFFLRNFSMKLASLVSPHHIFSFFFFLPTIFITKQLVGNSRKIIEFILLFVSFISSPVIAVFCYSVYLIPELRLKNVTSYLLFTVLLFALYYALFSQPPTNLFLRQSANEVSLFPRLPIIYYLLLPLILIGVSGMQGLMATYLIANKFKWQNIWFLFPMVGMYYFLEGAELQRHFSIFASFYFTVYLIQKVRVADLNWQVLSFGLLISMPLHLYFIYCFTGKENLVNKDIEYKNYFSLSEKLHQFDKNATVLSAPPFKNGGFPIFMEKNISYSSSNDVFIYHHLKQNDLPILIKARAQKTILPYATEAGYRYITWGPLEEERWGNSIKKRFINQNKAIAKSGEVSLYLLDDRYSSYLKISLHESNCDTEINRFQFLANEGWHQEASEGYLVLTKKCPNNARLRNEFANLLIQYKKWDEAIGYLNEAIRIDPTRSELRHNLANAIQGKVNL